MRDAVSTRGLIQIHTSLHTSHLKTSGLHDDEPASQWALCWRQKPPEHLIHSFSLLNSSEDSCWWDTEGQELDWSHCFTQKTSRITDSGLCLFLVVPVKFKAAAHNQSSENSLLWVLNPNKHLWDELEHRLWARPDHQHQRQFKEKCQHQSFVQSSPFPDFLWAKHRTDQLRKESADYSIFNSLLLNTTLFIQHVSTI